MKLFTVFLLIGSFFQVSLAKAEISFFGRAKTYIQLVRDIPFQSNMMHFLESHPGQPIGYNPYSEETCAFIGYTGPSDRPYKAGQVFEVQKIDQFRGGGPPSPFYYVTVWRFEGGRVDCTNSHRPNAPYANKLMRGYVRIMPK